MDKASYFVNEAAEYEFYLLHMDGEQRSKALGIEERHYRSKTAALNWHESIRAKLIPLGSLAAHQKLDSMYRRMIDH